MPAINGLRYPSIGDNTRIPSDLQNLATDLQRKLGSTVADVPALLALSNMSAGDRVYVKSIKKTAVFDGTGWTNYTYTTTPWTNMTLGSPWSVYDTSFEVPAYRKINNVVYLKGLVKASGAPIYSIISTLPAGFRPGTRKMYSQFANGGVVRIDIETNGTISTQGYPAGTDAGYVTLTMNFLAEA